jgi:hypothetical protein
MHCRAKLSFNRLPNQLAGSASRSERNPRTRTPRTDLRLEFSGQEDVKKLIWLIYQGFVFDRKCTPEPQ